MLVVIKKPINKQTWHNLHSMPFELIHFVIVSPIQDNTFILILCVHWIYYIHLSKPLFLLPCNPPISGASHDWDSLSLGISHVVIVLPIEDNSFIQIWRSVAEGLSFAEYKTYNNYKFYCSGFQRQLLISWMASNYASGSINLKEQLRKCWDSDFDWTLLPDNIAKVRFL